MGNRAIYNYSLVYTQAKLAQITIVKYKGQFVKTHYLTALPGKAFRVRA